MHICHVAGVELLTPTVASIAECLIKGEVPDAWDAVWEGPAEVNKWLSGLASRTHSLPPDIGCTGQSMLSFCHAV